MEIQLSIGFISYVSSASLSLFLLIIYFVGVQKEHTGKPFILLVLATLAWSILLILNQLGGSRTFDMVMIAELLRYYTWIYVLQTADGREYGKSFSFSLNDPLSPLNISILFILATVVVIFYDSLGTLLQSQSLVSMHIGIMLLFSILGLVIVEQLFRNTPESDRWTINFLCISAGAIFVYDFFVYSNAFLLQAIDYEFWSARGIVNALIMPALVMASVRNPQLAPQIHISRTFIFHSTTLFGSGVYLFIMSIAGIYIRESSGEWGKVLQAAFLFAALLLLVTVFFSSTIKTRIKRYLSYSFRNKYDYRDEWNRFSLTLLAPDSDISLYQRSLKAIAQIVESEGGTLWLKDHQHYVLTAEYIMTVENPVAEQENSILIKYIRKNHDLFTREEFEEYANNSGISDHWFLNSKKCWLIIPLWVNNHLFGYIELQKSIVGMKLDIEDQDLLNTIAHHVALSLSLKETDSALQQAQRFKEVNQITAFLMHDLKTVLSQLSLLVENGKVHKDNPEFIGDMLTTVEHVSQKMKRLVHQLQEPEQQLGETANHVIMVIEKILTNYKHSDIKPVFVNEENLDPVINCNEESMISAIKHIVQNAIESCDKNGKVIIELKSEDQSACVLTVTDNGKGMNSQFIAERLFQPFDSTKGVSGMGVGVYQSREFFRSLNGDLTVQSKTGEGTIFTMRIPLNDE